jgi:hypothetical protein
MWSRRKAAVLAEAEAEKQAQMAAVVAQERAVLAEKTDAEVLAELGLQDPETLQAGDDFAAFMQAQVPERLRKRALRVLWRSNPVLANVDNLVDYGEDFAAEGVLGEVVQTIYQVGKGILVEPEEAEPEPEAVVLAEAPVNEAFPQENKALPEEPAEDTLPLDAPENTEITENTEFRVKRRMRFVFVDEE